jgi:hypothetical protein
VNNALVFVAQLKERKLNNDWLEITDTWWAELVAMWEAGKKCTSDFERGSPRVFSVAEVNSFVNAAFEFPTIHEILKRIPEHTDGDTSERYRGDPQKIEKNSAYNESAITLLFLQWFVLKQDIKTSPYYFDTLLVHLRRTVNITPSINVISAKEEMKRVLEEKKWLNN